MGSQISALCEQLVAKVAGEGLLAGVDEHVIPNVGRNRRFVGAKSAEK